MLRLPYNDHLPHLNPSWKPTGISFNFHSTYHSTFNCFAISAHRIKNCEIRVGLDESDIGNNAVCVLWLEEMGPMVSKRFSCIPNLYGNWISVNKTTPPVGAEILQLQEVQVFGSGYYPTMGLTYPPPPLVLHICVGELDEHWFR